MKKTICLLSLFSCLVTSGCASVNQEQLPYMDASLRHAPFAPWNDNGRIHHELLIQKAHEDAQIDVYFVGDSITRRWGATDYPAFLKHWNETFFGWNAADFGWGGDSTHHMLWRIQNGELDGLSPKVFVILAGTNNIGKGEHPERAADAAEGVAALIDICLKKSPDSKVVVMGIFPRNDSPLSNALINQANAEIETFADGEKVIYLNINDQLADSSGKLYDGLTLDLLHPDLAGYKIWAKNLVPVLTKLLGEPATEDHAPAPTGDPSAK
ncbi:MAG: hypothetical protein JW739_02260 [Opitutales bacterium]|nr:hypothetical protein [Opitutales bacterium]